MNWCDFYLSFHVKIIIQQAAYSIPLFHNKTMSNGHSIVFVYRILSTDGGTGEEEERESSAHAIAILSHSNITISPLSKINNPREKELIRFSSVWAQQSYCWCTYFLKQRGTHKYFIFPNLALTEKKKDCHPFDEGKTVKQRVTRSTSPKPQGRKRLMRFVKNTRERWYEGQTTRITQLSASMRTRYPFQCSEDSMYLTGIHPE